MALPGLVSRAPLLMQVKGAMVASWVSQASFEPLGLTVAVAKDRAIESLLQARPACLLHPSFLSGVMLLASQVFFELLALTVALAKNRAIESLLQTSPGPSLALCAVKSSAKCFREKEQARRPGERQLLAQ